MWKFRLQQEKCDAMDRLGTFCLATTTPNKLFFSIGAVASCPYRARPV
jgi:hypothetical protein